MDIRELNFDQINIAPYNPRKDLQPGDPEYERLVRSVNEFGYVQLLVWNERTGNLVGGHQGLKILKARGDTKGHFSVVNLDVEREKALNLALNKVRGDWDNDLLAELLSELEGLEFETGFDPEEIELILAGAEEICIDGIFEETEPKEKPPKVCPHCGEEL